MQRHAGQQLVIFFLLTVFIMVSFSLIYSLTSDRTGAALRALEPLSIEPPDPDQDVEPTEPLEQAPTGITTTTYFRAGVLLASKRSDTETISYYVQDHLGSNQQVLEDDEPVQTNTMFAFGETLSAGEAPNAYKFTGKEQDGTGLYYYGARYYAPAVGRFLQADPVAANLADPLTLNKYAYVKNNPLIFVDPSGSRERIYVEVTNTLTISNPEQHSATDNVHCHIYENNKDLGRLKADEKGMPFVTKDGDVKSYDLSNNQVKKIKNEPFFQSLVKKTKKQMAELSKTSSVSSEEAVLERTATAKSSIKLGVLTIIPLAIGVYADVKEGKDPLAAAAGVTEVSQDNIVTLVEMGLYEEVLPGIYMRVDQDKGDDENKDDSSSPPDTNTAKYVSRDQHLERQI